MPTHDEALRAFELLAQLPGEPDTVNKPFSTLSAYLKQAKEDADRLDLLDADVDNHVVKLRDRWYSRDWTDMSHRRATNVRTAIDAAIAARSAKPGETT